MMPETCTEKRFLRATTQKETAWPFLSLRLSPQQLEEQAYGLRGNQTLVHIPALLHTSCVTEQFPHLLKGDNTYHHAIIRRIKQHSLVYKSLSTISNERRATGRCQLLFPFQLAFEGWSDKEMRTRNHWPAQPPTYLSLLHVSEDILGIHWVEKLIIVVLLNILQWGYLLGNHQKDILRGTTCHRRLSTYT